MSNTRMGRSTTLRSIRADEPWHGTSGGYTNHRCRCIPCRVANTEATQASKMRRLAQRITVDGRPFHPRAVHGTHNGYKNYGCRCLPCTDTNNMYAAHYRRTHKPILEAAA